MPRELPEEDRKEFRRLAKQLAPYLCSVDAHALAVLAGLTVRIKQPGASRADFRAYMGMAREFGMTKATRGKIPVLPLPPEPEEP
jgi:hypothetical protein